MRRFCLLTLGTCAIAAGAAAAANGSPAGVAANSYLQVTAREFNFILSRSSVKRGELNIELVNYGEDDHDVAIQRKRGKSGSTAMGVVHPGDRGTLKTKVYRGTYVLWCTISDHKRRGMRSELKVTR